MGQFDFVDRPHTPDKKSKKAKSGTSPAVIAGGVVAVGIVGFLAVWMSRGKPVRN